jgi:hypothetical protein
VEDEPRRERAGDEERDQHGGGERPRDEARGQRRAGVAVAGAIALGISLEGLTHPAQGNPPARALGLSCLARRRRIALAHPARFAALAALLLAPFGALAQSPDWEALADVGTLQVITHDEDGAPRETKIWLAVVDGQGFIRTGDTAWGDDVERDPNVVLRIEDVEYPLLAEFIEAEGLRERVETAFREKYGWSDAMIGLFRGGNPRIMHMIPR